MIDSSVARALASSLCTLWCWPSGLVVKVKFSEVIPWSLLTAVHFPPWSLSLCTEARETLVKTEAKKEYVNSICVCCHCMLTPLRQQAYVVLVQPLTAGAGGERSCCSWHLLQLGFDFPGTITLPTAWAMFLNSSMVVCPSPTYCFSFCS